MPGGELLGVHAGHWLALFLGLLDFRLLGLNLGVVQLVFELCAGLFELAHALAETAGKGRQFFRAKKHENEDGDDDQLGGAERTE